ncbi:sugar phosphate isomerase/epimerase [Paenibacillus sp. YN15]|uniref:sugar phosphate isomerase/epimerase family protein n=1 Tax=Paenibacillus sp. YN15 TaxID=1742774 RepID=UPI000DCC7A60|nr:sugar phosphate isomerase/epimerase [Paenibacillus sp. YN15]RAU96166.1 sugar phosphate isomerase/epimerase [Paenibacillus sp. YN15]
MELSLSMWSVHRSVKENGWTVLDFVDFCNKEGIKQVELLNVFWKNAAIELPAVAAAMKSKGVRASSYAVSNDFAKEDPAERKAALQEILDALPVAQTLGVNVIRVFSGNLTEHVTYDNALDWIAEGLSAAAEAAGKAGITLCLENHGKLAGSGVQVKAILDRVNSPYLKSTFDTGNFLLVDEEPLKALDVLIDDVAHVHFKDFIQQADGRYKSLAGAAFEGVSLGLGDVDLAAIVRRLKERGYQGAYVLEYEGLGSEAEGIRKSYEFFNTLG